MDAIGPWPGPPPGRAPVTVRPVPRTTLRLVVPSPDGTRVLARPNGLAGWVLPRIAVDAPFDTWNDETGTVAAAAVGAPVVHARPLADGAWVVRPDGRIPAAGATWIAEHELDRLGADADVARAWFVHGADDGA